MSGLPEVTVASGRLRGTWRGTTAAFLGIPFARAPVGDLRFAAPEPPEPWHGTRDATEYGPTTDRVRIPDHIMPETVVPGEATLNLNVFTPSTDAARLPVMVWFHGGGYVSGSPKNDWYEGESFTRDGVIVVTVDYRLGFDGFGFIDGAPHNRGVRDWLAALAWVRDNIEAFGGDPGRVTIAGQSAGGGAVLTLLGMPVAQPLFRAAICLSGAIADVPAQQAAAYARRLAARARVTPDRAGFSGLTEQRLLELQTIESAGRGRLAAARPMFTGLVPIGPMIDGDLLTRPTLDSLAAGVGADKPLLMVSLDDELTTETQRSLPAALGLLPRLPVLRYLGLSRPVARQYLAQHAELRTRRLAGQLLTDMLFRRLALDVTVARAAARTWLARVAWPAPRFEDASHCADLPFFFDILDAPTVRRMIGTTPPQHIADELHGAAVSLLRGQAPAWEPWTPDRGATRVFDTTNATELDGYRDVRVCSQFLRGSYQP